MFDRSLAAKHKRRENPLRAGGRLIFSYTLLWLVGNMYNNEENKDLLYAFTKLDSR